MNFHPSNYEPAPAGGKKGLLTENQKKIKVKEILPEGTASHKRETIA